MKTKKLLSLLLCAALLFSMTGVMALAADKPFYLVLGDSIAYGSGLANPNEAVYGKIVADTNDYDYANDAVPGFTTAALLSLMETDRVKADVEQADIISISIGGNNYLVGNLPQMMVDCLVKNDTAIYDEVAVGYYDDLCAIFAYIKGLNPDAVILMQTLYNPQVSYMGEVYQHGVDRINECVRRYDEEHPGVIEIVDVAARLTDHDTDFAADRVHPSAVGNEKIAVAVLEKLAELGLGASAEPVINTPGRDAYMLSALTRPLDVFAVFLHMLSFVYKVFVR
ncbi:MAG: hypothetical protein IJK98_11280 [Clostridia bacterium]|nr:hypothetical protein [Clostridia bacterium]